jgi:DNA-directed RNA polymerase subunit E"
MAKEKACRQCRRILDTEQEAQQNCPNCKGNQFTTFWRGFVVVVDPEKSEIARKVGIENPGKYALRLSR